MRNLLRRLDEVRSDMEIPGDGGRYMDTGYYVVKSDFIIGLGQWKNRFRTGQILRVVNAPANDIRRYDPVSNQFVVVNAAGGSTPLRLQWNNSYGDSSLVGPFRKNTRGPLEKKVIDGMLASTAVEQTMTAKDAIKLLQTLDPKQDVFLRVSVSKKK